jgi:hypothetical protein
MTSQHSPDQRPAPDTRAPAKVDRRRRIRVMAVGFAVGLALVAALVTVVTRGHARLFGKADAAQGLSNESEAGLNPVDPAASSASPGTPSKPGSGGPGATPTNAAGPQNPGSGNGGGPGGGGSPGPGSGSGAGPAPGSGDGTGSGSGSTGPVRAGDYRVGVDIAAGSWTTAGPLNVSICTYSVNGQPAIQISLVLLGTTIHLAAGDTFRTSGCADWRYLG